MFSLTVENSKNERLELTHSAAYTITSIEGLNPPEATINTIVRPWHDGSLFNSARVENRQIIITMAINGPAEANRNALYKFFRTGQLVRLSYVNGMHDVYIDGYIQYMTVDFFGQKQIAQITLVCTDPYFHGRQDDVTILGASTALFEFPFENESPGLEFSTFTNGGVAEVLNSGTVDTGVLITITASGTVEIPKIESMTTGEALGVAVRLSAGDQLIINTREDQKSIYMVSGGTITNEISNMTAGSSWIHLIPGINELSCDVHAGSVDSLSVEFDVRTSFQGV